MPGTGNHQHIDITPDVLGKARVGRGHAHDALGRRIDDLATKRLLPWEMMMAVIGTNKATLPKEIYFGRVYTTPGSGLYTLSIDAQTTSVSTISVYTSALKAVAGIESVETRGLQARGENATFTLVITFKSDAIKPGALL